MYGYILKYASMYIHLYAYKRICIGKYFTPSSIDQYPNECPVCKLICIYFEVSISTYISTFVNIFM